MSASFDSKTIRFKGMYCDEYTTVYNAMTSKPTAQYAGYQNTMVASLVSGGYWTRMDLLYILANNDSTNAKLNWINPGTFDLTDPGSTNPSFTAYQGFNGDGSSDYLSTGWNPLDDSVNVDLADISIAVWSLEDIRGANAASEMSLGVIDAGGAGILFMPRSGDAPGSLICALTGNPSFLGTNSSSIGFVLASRTASNVITGYVNGGTTNGSDNDISTGLPDNIIYLLAYNNQGTATGFSSNTISIVLVIDGVSEGESQAIYTIFHTYMTAIGQ